MPFALYLLAVAAFGMGTSEFMLAGLLPDIAADLSVGVGAAGGLTSAFAVGMVVGAPVVAAFARGWPRRGCLLGFLVVFAGSHVVGAVTSGFAVLIGSRFVAALAYAGFLAVALTTAAGLVPDDRKGRALAVLLAGTTAALVAGVPGGALLGAVAGWRAVFWAVAALCLPAAVGVALIRPGPRPERVPLRAELALLGRSALLTVMALGALVNAGTFAAFTYLAPLVTGRAGLDPLWVPVTMALFGIGAFAGVALAGRLADRRPWPLVAVGGPVLAAGWVVAALLADGPALLAVVAAQGVLSFAVGSTLIARVLYAASGAPTMAGAYATAALNVGATAGPLAGAAALGIADLGPLWAGAALVAAALTVAAACRRSLA